MAWILSTVLLAVTGTLSLKSDLLLNTGTTESLRNNLFNRITITTIGG